MIFVTVGTQFPFDRLVRRLDLEVGRALPGHEVFAQIGESAYRPVNLGYAQVLSSDEFEMRMKTASAVVSHAGMGTITMALRYEKPLLVLPRLRRFGEVVNDHQVAIARRFEESGHLLAAYSDDELAGGLQRLMAFVPRPRRVDPDAVSAAIAAFLEGVVAGRQSRAAAK
jgi:beta-1,4-N-acetylglucosaminyltransferase